MRVALTGSPPSNAPGYRVAWLVDSDQPRLARPRHLLCPNAARGTVSKKADEQSRDDIDGFNCHLDLTAQIRAPRNLAVKSRVPRNYVQFGTAQ